jgi:DNA processing protein
MTNLDALLILNASAGIGPIRARSLIEYFGSAEKVISASHEDLLAVPDIPEHAVLNILHFSKDKFLVNEYNLLRSNNVCVISDDHEDYPSLLRETASAPLVLYVQGKAGALKEPAVAIVGSRRASLYGMGISQKFAIELAQAGLTIVSGLARGIDTAAHQGALKSNGITIAVLGCGLCTIYPAENKKLAESITERGAVISEFPMETPPASFNFPRRNRIISGLSKGIVVVEAALKSGALITSDFALEQGRDVFAVPGKVGDPAAQGTNRLIQQGAKLTISVEDILQDLAPGLQGFRPTPVQPEDDLPTDNSLTEEEKMVCSSLSDETLHIDELTGKTGLSVTQAALVLFKLQLKKLVRQLPGQKYQKHSRGHNGKIISNR